MNFQLTKIAALGTNNAYLPNKSLALVRAYANLGQIAHCAFESQRALYMQLRAT
jgi:hypothetical protein